jgi:hypothetical protein
MNMKMSCASWMTISATITIRRTQKKKKVCMNCMEGKNRKENEKTKKKSTNHAPSGATRVVQTLNIDVHCDAFVHYPAVAAIFLLLHHTTG